MDLTVQGILRRELLEESKIVATITEVHRVLNSGNSVFELYPA